jgi:hypothetical protein
MEANLSLRQGKTTEKQRAKIFHQKMLQGDVRDAGRYLTKPEKEGILILGDINETLGDEVSKVLESKHPAARTPSTEALQPYPELPKFTDLHVTEDVVEMMAGWLSGAAGLGGTDVCALKH